MDINTIILSERRRKIGTGGDDKQVINLRGLSEVFENLRNEAKPVLNTGAEQEMTESPRIVKPLLKESNEL